MAEKRTGISPVLLVLACAITLALGWWLGLSRSHPTDSAGATKSGTTQLWTCGMHPQVIQDHPGLCPICHMELTPLAAGAGAGAGGNLLEIDPVVVQNMGVRVEPVRRAALSRSARFAGNVMEPENARLDIVLRVSGWIRKLYADTTGMDLAAGGPLFELDSPELGAAIEEFLAAGQAAAASTGASAKAAAESVLHASRARLAVFGLTPAQLAEYEEAGRAPPTVIFTTPVAAHLIEKSIREGSRVEAGTRVLSLSNRSDMWIDFAVPEADLSWLRQGARANARVPALGTRVLAGTVHALLPHVDETTRTARARLIVANPDMQLREGMTAEVTATAVIEEEPLVVPREAVIDTGLRRVAFVALGGGKFEPRDLELGPSGDEGLVAIRSGLKAGEQVVVSGQFLLDAESRIRESLRRFVAGNAPPAAVDASAPTGASAPAGGLQPRVDRFFRAYLEVAEQLGGTSAEAERFDAVPLTEAARALEGDGQGEAQKIARAITLQSKGLEMQKGAERRKTFQAVSDLAIRLADRQPPSRAVAPKLFVAHCPMAPGDWLQVREEIANPFYADKMKSCGEILRAIDAAKEH